MKFLQKLFGGNFACWDYQGGSPIVTVRLISDLSEQVQSFQVDTGFSGWFLLDWVSYQRLGLERSELPEEFWPQAHGFGGSRRLRAAYVQVQIPELGFEQAHVIYSAPDLDRSWNLVGLRFLDQFLWRGDGKRFCLQKRRSLS